MIAASSNDAPALAVVVGERLVVARAVALPDVCMKCGAVATERRARPFYFVAPWLWALLVLGPFGALGVLALTKSAGLAVPLCARCDARWNAATRARVATSAVAIALALAAVFWPLFAPGVVATLGAAAVTVGGLVVIVLAHALSSPRVLRAVSIDDARVALAGVHVAAREAAARATPGPAISVRATTRLAARLLVAHLLAYVLGFAWSIAAMPAAIRTIPIDVDPADVVRVSTIVMRRIVWPLFGVWIGVQLASLPWAFAKTDARAKWTRAVFFVVVAATLLSALGVGGVEWRRLLGGA